MSGPSPRLVVLRAAGEPPPPWERDLRDVPTDVADSEALPRWAAVLRDSGCVAVDGATRDPLERLRRAHRSDPAVQAVVVAGPGDRARIERSILFTPGLGEVWVVDPDQVGASLVQRAAEVTDRRRRYRDTRGRVQGAVAALEPHAPLRAVVSDAYLVALLDTIPDPVVSVDEAGRVLSWNPGAERVLGVTRAEAVGRPLSAVLVAARGQPPLPLDAATLSQPLRREVRFRRAGTEEGIGELVVLPVEAAGHRVRAVFLHDLTEERHVQEMLEAQAAELEAQSSELQEQAAELESANDELRQRTRDLEEALSARARFYAAMSHELRTPINAILGYQELILSGIYGPVEGEQRASLERAQRAARHLVELVNDVLDLAKIEAGRIELQVEPTYFPLLLDELLDTVRSVAERNGSEVRVHGQGRHEVRSDPRRVRQILLNLLSNAVKFGQGRPVAVRWEALPDGGVRVEVVDQGVGIAPEDRERIFEEFTQLSADEEGAAGTGLGLPISRRLAELLGGSLAVRSEPGRGSTFRLTLPARPPGRP